MFLIFKYVAAFAYEKQYWLNIYNMIQSTHNRIGKIPEEK